MKRIKKLLCTLMAIVMIFSSFAVAATAVNIDGEEIDHLPLIYINGFGSRTLHFKDDPDKNSLFFPVDTNRLMGNFGKFGEYTAESLKNADPDIIYNYLYSVFWDSFGPATLKPDGITNNFDTVECEPTVLTYSGNGLYDFNYDSRLDPVDIAKTLYDYVLQVQEHSGSKRFEIVGASYGSTILMAFLNEYPEMHQYIDSALISVPSYGGFSVVGELFSGNFFVDHDTLTQYAYTGIGSEELGLFLSVLNKSGFLKFFLECLVVPGVKAIAFEAAMDVIHDIFATIPAMWTFVQEEYFYDAMKNIYGENYADPSQEYAPLIKKVTYYQEQVVQRLDEIYRIAQESGIKMNIICKYGRPPMPISEKGSFMSDGAVDVKDVTLGATSSKYGETLPEGYKQALYPEYNFLSPDNCIDASTGIDPLHTWFVKGLEHTEKNSGFNKLIDYIVYEDPTVFSGSTFPQYTKAMPDGSLAPVTEPENKKETTLFEDLLELLSRLWALITEKLQGLFDK